MGHGVDCWQSFQKGESYCHDVHTLLNVTVTISCVSGGMARSFVCCAMVLDEPSGHYLDVHSLSTMLTLF